jgi:hypothetical protein
MQTADINDPLFQEAVLDIDTGNIPALQELIMQHPRLIREPLLTHEKGYFENPYLLWFVADNPIRHDQLPANIVEVTTLLIAAYKKEQLSNWQHILDYTLGLVTTGRIPRKCGVQLPLMKLLIDEGATVGIGHGALAFGNFEAAAYLLERGGELTLTTAVCLDRQADVQRLLPAAGKADLQIALMAAAFFGKTAMLSLLLQHGADPNIYLDASSGFHHHATALHQAIWSGSLEAVKVLVAAGADLTLKDKIYGGTPIGWAMYMQESGDLPDLNKEKIAVIEAYLRSKYPS